MRKLLILTTFVLSACASLTALATDRKTNIDKGWKFHYGDGKQALDQPSVTSQWRTLDLPHDWSVETEAAKIAGGTVIGPFSTNSVGGYQTGFTVGGEGWYAKKIEVKDLDQRTLVYFEGAYNQTEVYLNGEKLYFNPYGYISFRVDVTKHLKKGDNWLMVRVMNEGNNTRWYAGSGIYRHVWLIQTPKDAYLDEWDLFARSEKMSNNSWVLKIDAPIKANGNLKVQHTLYDNEGKEIAQVIGGGNHQRMWVSQPNLWSPEHPYCYTLVSQLKKGRKVMDEITTKIGFRTIEFSAEKGFLLNGKSTYIYGGCVHHDNGLLGAAAYDRAEVRKLEILKAQGYNAIRTSHGLPSEKFIEACDSLGLMVMDETFDQWLIKKNNDDYHKYFVEHSTNDIQTMIRRDRNHPSIIMWGIGNEIPGRIEPKGMEVAERLRKAIQEYDTTRPITAAICGWDIGDSWNAAGHSWDQQDNNAFRSLDIAGYNYRYHTYEHDHSTHPDRVICGLESYPRAMAKNWDMVEKHPYVIGDFIWTAMDYLGEAGIGSSSYRKEGNQTMFQPWPWYNGWCGDIDLIGQKKPQSYCHDVIWRRSPITMAVETPAPEKGTYQSVSGWGWQLEEQSWTFPQISTGDTLKINVYSRAPKVRLYLNNKSMGDQKVGDTYRAIYKIPYSPGELRVVNLDASGKEVANESYTLQTTSKPVALRLTADRDKIYAGQNDLSFVTVELVDAEGRVCTSNSELQVRFYTEGDGGELLTAGNGASNDMHSFRSAQPRLYQGRALAILRGGEKTGRISLKAEAQGVQTANIDIEVISVK